MDLSHKKWAYLLCIAHGTALDVPTGLQVVGQSFLRDQEVNEGREGWVSIGVILIGEYVAELLEVAWLAYLVLVGGEQADKGVPNRSHAKISGQGAWKDNILHY